jgi:hypothetical protein
MSRIPALVLFAALLSTAFGPAARAERLTDVEETSAASHLDLTFGAGTQTAGLGATLGYTAASGLRAEASLGTIGVSVGGSVAVGAAFRVLERGRHRLDVPLLASFTAAFCAVCGTDASRKRYGGIGAATGLDWLVGHDAESAGFVLSLRVGAAEMATKDAYDPEYTATRVIPLAQLGLGWTF